MSVKVLINTKNQRFNFPAVSVNVKLRRLSLNQSAFLFLVEQYESESQYAQILLDDSKENKGVFWVKLCDGKSPGSRKLDSSSKSTRTCNIRGLIESLNLSNTETSRFEMQWDQELEAGKINTQKPLGSEGGEIK